MADFPILKTGALAQYPAQRVLGKAARVIRFVDGAEQSLPVEGSPLRRWVLDLSLLDEDEVSRIGRFFDEQAGALSDFAFTDPWDGTAYASCRFEADELREQIIGEGRASMKIVIRQNRT